MNHNAKYRITSLATTTLLLVMMVLSLIAERNDYYDHNFYAFFLTEMTVAIAITVLLQSNRSGSKAGKKDWPAIAVWGGFTLYTLFSDVLVEKNFRFAETIVFVGLLILGYVWNNSLDKSRFIQDLERAVQWFLFALLFLSVFFPLQCRVPDRYSGPIENPSVYALYLCSIWAVLLGSLEDKIGNKERGVRIAVTLGEMAVTLVLMIMSQSLTPIIALAAVSFLWLFRLIRSYKGTRFAVVISVSIGMVAVVILVLMVIIVRNTGLYSDSRIVQKLQSSDVSTFLSDRDNYWRRYLREMNLFGHGKKPFLWDHRILPHNALIGMMYWYGVPCVIPYILMMMMSIEKSWRFANTGLRCSAIPFYCISSFIIMSMADNVEQPFVWLPWIACYLMMAPILVLPVEEIEALKTEKLSKF